ncbi:MAG TPA: aminotransferase class V-fold PLP-dependent enzyme [Gemmatimonadaceae bacterium]|nr:aminotransferase class V-fold PLP-dependent enzyme [Gemmatimonadaceae bacterium]
MPTRRAFLSSVALAGAALPTFHVTAMRRLWSATAIAADRAPGVVAADEEYWGEIQRAFDIDRTLINLNSGGVSPTPSYVLEAMIRDVRFSNEAPVHHMWNVIEPRIESVRTELAREFGCDPEEMSITRNASESMETLILGLDLQRGDEVIVTNQNYPRMLTTWRQRARRDGIVLREVSFRVPPPSMDYLVERFREAITPRTRVLEVTHITNLTGQIMPVRPIVRMARERGITVLVDGAHAFAQFPFKRDELECDYYATSLHKWLTAPVGTGFLYVRRERIKSLWPLMAAPTEMDDNIRKFEEIGTHPAANHNAIAAALIFHRGIGAERKAQRLRYLRDRWSKRLMTNPRVKVLTNLDPAHSCGIALVHLEGVDTAALHTRLFEKWRIITTPILHPEFNGLRVTPNVFTTLDEVDVFAERMEEVLKTGVT